MLRLDGAIAKESLGESCQHCGAGSSPATEIIGVDEKTQSQAHAPKIWLLTETYMGEITPVISDAGKTSYPYVD